MEGEREKEGEVDEGSLILKMVWNKMNLLSAISTPVLYFLTSSSPEKVREKRRMEKYLRSCYEGLSENLRWFSQLVLEFWLRVRLREAVIVDVHRTAVGGIVINTAPSLGAWGGEWGGGLRGAYTASREAGARGCLHCIRWYTRLDVARREGKKFISHHPPMWR